MLRPRTRTIPEHFEQRPIAEVAEELGLQLTLENEPWYVCRCPLHDDHNPSLRVNVRENFWVCFPCAIGGDALELVYQVRRRSDPNFTRYDAYRIVVENTSPVDSISSALRDSSPPETDFAVELSTRLRALRQGGYNKADLIAVTDLLLRESQTDKEEVRNGRARL